MAKSIFSKLKAKLKDSWEEDKTFISELKGFRKFAFIMQTIFLIIGGIAAFFIVMGWD